MRPRRASLGIRPSHVRSARRVSVPFRGMAWDARMAGRRGLRRRRRPIGGLRGRWFRLSGLVQRVDSRRGGRATRPRRVGARAGGRGDGPVAGYLAVRRNGLRRVRRRLDRGTFGRVDRRRGRAHRAAPGVERPVHLALLPPGALLPRFDIEFWRGLRRGWCRHRRGRRGHRFRLRRGGLFLGQRGRGFRLGVGGLICHRRSKGLGLARRRFRLRVGGLLCHRRRRRRRAARRGRTARPAPPPR